MKAAVIAGIVSGAGERARLYTTPERPRAVMAGASRGVIASARTVSRTITATTDGWIGPAALGSRSTPRLHPAVSSEAAATDARARASTVAPARTPRGTPRPGLGKRPGSSALDLQKFMLKQLVMALCPLADGLMPDNFLTPILGLRSVAGPMRWRVPS